MSDPDDDDLDDPMLRALAAAPPIALGAPDLAPGTIVGQSYRLIRTLGAGAMGVVYEATDLVLSRNVAIKVHEIGRSDRAARLWREARAMAQLSHPNVVTVYEVGIDGERGFIAMELVAGTNARAWRSAATRHWSEIVEVYRQAGAGLAAAHDAGLVHRDFKPDNVLIGDDGRVRVADFGLALRPQQPTEASTEGTGRDRDSVTRTGTTMGTPAYMAPEQVRREGADARSDQYAFCVALHEALYLRRPGNCDTRTQRDVRSSRSSVSELERDSDVDRDAVVPAWIRVVLDRGLAAERSHRYPDMHALVAALDPAPRRRRRVIVAVLGVAAFVGALLLRLGGWLAASAPAADPCADAGTAIDQVWSPDDASRLAQTYAAAVPRIAQTTTAILRPALDEWTGEWRAEARAACEATHVRGEQSLARLDLRMDCLARAQRRLVAVVELLQSPDPATLARAESVVQSLPDVTMCARADAGIAFETVASEDADAYARLSADLDRAVATAAAGRKADAQVILDPLVEQLRAEEFHRELAEALRVRSAVMLEMGRHDDALEDATAATAISLYFGDRDATARATFELARATNRAAADLEGGRRWLDATRAIAEDLGWSRARMSTLREAELEIAFFADAFPETERLAEALLPELGPDEPLRVRVLSLWATALERQARFEEALVRHDEALALVERIRGPNHPQTAMVLGNRVASLRMLEMTEECRTSLDRVLAIRRDVFGPDSPVVGHALREMGDFLGSIGEGRRAIAKYEEAIAIHRAAGDDHGLFFDLGNLGPMLLEVGDANAAGRRLDEAVEIGTRAFGADSVRVSQVLINRSQMSLVQGEPARAVSELERALAIMKRKLPADDMNVGLAQVGLGIATVASGRGDDGIVQFDAGVAIAAAKLPPRHTRRVDFARTRAELLRDAGRPEAALAQTRDAARLADELLPEADPVRVDVWVAVANALLDAGRRAEARTALDEARARMAALRGEDSARAAEIDAAMRRAGRGGRATSE
jgi:tetratricopeptide (TPR) repeat protein